MKFNKNRGIFAISILLILFLSISMASAIEISADDADIDSGDLSVSQVSTSDCYDETVISADASGADSNDKIIINETIADEKTDYRSSILADGEKKNLHVEVSNDVFTPDNDYEFMLYDEDSNQIGGDLDIYLNDELTYPDFTVDSSESSSISLSGLECGLYNITFIYDEDDVYNRLNQTKAFYLYGENPEFVIIPNYDTITLNGNYSSRVYLKEYDEWGFYDEDNEGDIEPIDDKFNVYIYKENPGDEYELVWENEFEANGTINFDDAIKTTGNYLIRYVFNGSSDYSYAPYNSSNIIRCVNVITEFIINDTYFIPDKGFGFSVYLADNATGDIIDKEFKLIVYYILDTSDPVRIVEEEMVKGNKTYTFDSSEIPDNIALLFIGCIFDGDGYEYSSAEREYALELSDSRIETSIHANIGDSVIGNSSSFRVYVQDEDHWGQIDATLDIYLNEEYFQTVTAYAYLENEVLIENLKKGENTLRIVYNGTDVYQNSEKSYNFTVSDKRANIEVDVSNIIVGDVTKITVNLTDEDGNILNKEFNVSIYKGGSYYDEDSELIYSQVYTGSANISLPDLEIDDYYVRAEFVDESFVYSQAEDSEYFNVYSKGSYIDLGKTYWPDNDDVVLNISLKNLASGNINGNVLLQFNGTDYPLTCTEDGAILNLGKLPVGKYQIFAKFDGDGEYEASNLTDQLRIVKATIINVEACDVLKGQSETVNITFTDGDGNPLDVKILDINIWDTDGNWLDYGQLRNSIEIKNIQTDYIIRAMLSDSYGEIGYSDYYPSSAYGFIRVLNGTDPSVITVTNTANIDLAIDGPKVIITLTDEDGKSISGAKLNAAVGNMESILTTDSKGQAVLAIGANDTAKVTYTDENGAGVSASIVNNVINTTVTEIVEKNITVPVTANATIDLAIDGSDVVVSLNDLDGNAIASASLDATVGTTNSTLTTDDKGQAKVAIGVNETAKVTYTDENGASVSASIVNNVINSTVIVNNTVKRNATKIIYNNMSTVSVNAKVDGRIGEYFNVTLVDSDGNPLANKTVYIGFNGRVYVRQTNETGGAHLQINLGYQGDYTFAIAFLGDDDYNGSFEVAIIKVSKQSGKLTSSPKTYKAKAKTKTVSATFTSSYGNPIPGKKISFIVNGKTYSAKTDSKGVATVKVSLSKKGTYTCNIKFAGNGMYTESIATSKITIK